MDKVVVGMSGGVDSAVAAYLLKKKGYEVIGVYLKLHSSEDGSSDDARDICNDMGIPFHIIDLKDDFEKEIISYFKEEYDLGRTPNPCVRCNKYIKFGKFIDKALELGANIVATGHYSKIVYDNDLNRYLIKKSKEASKDQTYMLYTLTQEKLSRVLFPLGDFESKEEVRKVAEEIGLDVSSKSDSQDICFIPDNDYIRYLSDEGINFESGEFKDLEGKVLGPHKGVQNYTVGQRKGLGVNGGPYYVNRIDGKSNVVYLGRSEDLYSIGAIIKDVNIIYADNVEFDDALSAKVRYEKNDHSCYIERINDKTYKVIFKEKVRAITPGQSLVIYKGDYLYGGGVIDEVIWEE